MRNIVGVFTSRADAEQAIEKLHSAGIADRRISFLTPDTPHKTVESVPTTAGEQPGMGRAVGSLVGGALGTAGGLHAGAALASIMIPGVGPVLAAGLIAGALGAAAGVAAGGAAGENLEDSLTEGVPTDEMFIYEDALRQGRSVVIAAVEDDDQADMARGILTGSGAESIDAARDQWWVGLRSAEEEHYLAQGGDFARDEAAYRRGFEAAQHYDLRGKRYAESIPFLQQCYGNACREKPFELGFERGRVYREQPRQPRHRAA